MSFQAALFTLPGDRCRARGDDLRALVHRYLMDHPMRTAFEITRGLRMADPRAAEGAVRNQLRRMEGDGEAERYLAPRTFSDTRKAIRWIAT